MRRRCVRSTTRHVRKGRTKTPRGQQARQGRASQKLIATQGLGKTAQVLALPGHLKSVCGAQGPHLVVVPETVVENWSREIARWTPAMEVVVLDGDKDEPKSIIKMLFARQFDILLTSDTTCITEASKLKCFGWQTIVVDEAHAIKDPRTRLARTLRAFGSQFRLAMSGRVTEETIASLTCGVLPGNHSAR